MMPVMLRLLSPFVTRTAKQPVIPAPPAPNADAGDGGARPPISPAAALLLMAAVVLVWGANWPIMKIGLQDIPPLFFALARMLLGSACLFTLLTLRGELRVPGRRDLPVVLTVGLLQLAAYLSLMTFGLQFVEAGRSAILCYTTPIWVAPLAAVFAGERLTAGKLAGLAVGLTGIAVLFNPLSFDWSNHTLVLGNGLLLAGALAWAIAIVHIRGHSFNASPLQLAPWQMLVGCVPVAILAFTFENSTDIAPGSRLWAVLAYNGPFATAFALWAWVTVNRALPALTTSMASLGVPSTGLIAASLWLGEPITPHKGLGLVLITGGIAIMSLTALGGKRRKRAP